MFDGRWRSQVDAAMKPIGRTIHSAGISADMITTAGVVVSVGAAVAIGAGALSLGVLLVVLAAVPDLLDGAVAKAAGRSSTRGAFFDSVSDRLTDGVLLIGVTYFLITQGVAPWVVLLPVLAIVTGSLPSYVRAKADALGFDGSGGLVERAERLVLLVVGLLFGLPVLAWVLGLTVALNLVTGAQRFAKVWRQATDASPTLAKPRRRRTPRAGRSAAERRAEWRNRRDSMSRRPRSSG